ncbi:MAG: FtsX-like permease family protein, partial [Lachnospiraceae bacterium]
MVTSIMTRKREFAMLKSIGMTEKQLKIMLVYEGGWYAILTILLSLVICGVLSTFMGDVLSSMFWFFRYNFTMTPIAIVTPIFLVIGILIPYVVYHFFRGESIVEQLRQVE